MPSRWVALSPTSFRRTDGLDMAAFRVGAGGRLQLAMDGAAPRAYERMTWRERARLSPWLLLGIVAALSAALAMGWRGGWHARAGPLLGITALFGVAAFVVVGAERYLLDATTTVDRVLLAATPLAAVAAVVAAVVPIVRARRAPTPAAVVALLASVAVLAWLSAFGLLAPWAGSHRATVARSAIVEHVAE